MSCAIYRTDLNILETPGETESRKNMGEFCAVWFQYITVALFPFILQTVSLFSNLWAVKDGYTIGLFYKSTPDGDFEIDS